MMTISRSYLSMGNASGVKGSKGRKSVLLENLYHFINLNKLCLKQFTSTEYDLILDYLPNPVTINQLPLGPPQTQHELHDFLQVQGLSKNTLNSILLEHLKAITQYSTNITHLFFLCSVTERFLWSQSGIIKTALLKAKG